MPTQIKQIDDQESRTTVFRLSGEMFQEDAELLSRIARDRFTESSYRIEIDLADVTLIDSDAASTIKHLTDVNGFTIVGTEILLQNAIDLAERT